MHIREYEITKFWAFGGVIFQEAVPLRSDRKINRVGNVCMYMYIFKRVIDCS